MDPVGHSGDLITKSFLEIALRKEGKYDAEIISFKVAPGTKPGENYMSVIYTIDLDLNFRDCDLDEGVTLTRRSLLIKCYPSHPGRQASLNGSNLFHKELTMYTKWIPGLYRMQLEVLNLEKNEIIPLPFVPLVYGECIDFYSEEGKQHSTRTIGPLENFVIFEDIRKMQGFRMPNRFNGLDIHHMHLAIKALAKMHAMSWAYRHHLESNIIGKFPCMVKHSSPQKTEVWTNITKGNLNQAAKLFEEHFGPGNELSKVTLEFRDKHVTSMFNYFVGTAGDEVFKNTRRVEIDVKKYRRRDDKTGENWRVICHGDYYNNNLMFRYDENDHPIDIIVVDLQMPNEGCLTRDLQNVIYNSTNGELRQNHLDSLLQLYYEEFNEICGKLRVKTLPGFTLEELRYRFDRSKLYGFFLASMCLPIDLKEEEKAVDLEKIDKDADMQTTFKDVNQGGAKDNQHSGESVYFKRISEITREMYEQGVI